MLIKNAEIKGEIVDIRLKGGLITALGKCLSGGEVFDARGRALIPGLHDHHIHLNASAAAMNSVKCGPPDVTSETGLVSALRAHPGNGFLRAIGYHPSVAGEIDRHWLDENGPDRPIRIQHRSGRLWIMNSLAMQALELSGPDNGRFYDADKHIRRNSGFPDLKPLVEKLLSLGITGVTEVTPGNCVEDYKHYLKAARPLRLNIMGGAELSGRAGPYMGPLKLHYHDHDLPALDALSCEIKAAHDKGRNIAAHCVTRAELMLTLAAIEQAGPVYGDRIEHAAIADDAAIAWMKTLGVIVVTQPNFISERLAAYAAEVPKVEHKNLWRLKAFDAAGIRLAAGSDAPFGNVDPWAAMAAAVSRPQGFEQEAISPERALELYTKPAHDAGGHARKFAPGQAADLCLLDVPWGQARQDLARVKVKATWINGALVYDSVNQTPV